MPWCRHCLKKFNNWPNFYYHVNSRSCDGLRDFYQGQNPGLALAAMNQALIERSDVLKFAQGCTWLELAGHPAVRELIQHCPVCFHWVATPQYMKRHMKAKHPELSQMIDDCTEFVKTSNTGIVSPCRFCGVEFQRRDAHLRSCAGLFCGAFAYTRVARGKPLNFTRHDRGRPQPEAPSRGDRGAQADRVAGTSGQRGIRQQNDPPGNGAAEGGSGVGGAVGAPDTGPGPRQGEGRQALEVEETRCQRPGRPRKRPQRQRSEGQDLRELFMGAAAGALGDSPTTLGRSSGGRTAQGAPAAPAKRGPPDHPGPSSRQPTNDQRPGHGLHDLCPDRHPREPGGDPVRGGESLECDKGGHSGKAVGTHAHDLDAEAAVGCPAAVHPDHGTRRQAGAGQAAGLAVGGRQGHARDDVGPGAQTTRPQPGHSRHLGGHDQGGPHGDDRPLPNPRCGST